MLDNFIRSIELLDITPRPEAGEVFPSPQDWRDMFIYFLLIDRFNDSGNSPPYKCADGEAPMCLKPVYNPKCSDKESQRCRNPFNGKRFQGGKISGIISKLDYIQNLGCNAIWISPIFKNRIEDDESYHGYGIQNFLEVDPRFGTLSDLQKLVKAAHERGIYVILDVVINHTGNNWGYLKEIDGREVSKDFSPYGQFEFGFWRNNNINPADKAVWPVELRNPDYYNRRGSIGNGWDDPVEGMNGDFVNFKKLDLMNPEVMDLLVKIYKYWIAVSNTDGFRLDTAKHMEPVAVARFSKAIHEYAKSIGKHNFFIFGEINSNDDRKIRQYVGDRIPTEGMEDWFYPLDSALDFPLHEVLHGVFKGFLGPDQLRKRYEMMKLIYPDHGEVGDYFITFLDNHDKPKRFMHDTEKRYACQAILAMGYLLTSRGIPCIYYGTEQGFDGGNFNNNSLGGDHFVRECMFGGNWGAFDTIGLHFFNEENDIYKEIGKIAKIRADEPALRYGKQKFSETSGDCSLFEYPCDKDCTIAFTRTFNRDEVLVAMNISEFKRNDYISMNSLYTPPGSELTYLLKRSYEMNDSGELINDNLPDEKSLQPLKVEGSRARAYLQVDLEPYSMAILKRAG